MCVFTHKFQFQAGKSLNFIRDNKLYVELADITNICMVNPVNCSEGVAVSFWIKAEDTTCSGCNFITSMTKDYSLGFRMGGTQTPSAFHRNV